MQAYCASGKPFSVQPLKAAFTEIRTMPKDWLDSVIEGATASACEEPFIDPVEQLDKLEHDLIASTGCNLAGKPINTQEIA